MIVDQYPSHYYQPGFLFMPFGIYSARDVVKAKRKFIPRGVDYAEAGIDRIQTEQNRLNRLKAQSAMEQLAPVANRVRDLSSP